MITVKLTNDYTDGHHSTREVLLPPPTGNDLEYWWMKVVWPETGDGHGAEYPDLGSCYTAEIVAVDEEDVALLGETYEWID